MDKWRPDNWDSFRPKAVLGEVEPEEGNFNNGYLTGFEAGADAMLEALKKKGDYCNHCSLNKYWGKKGWLVFVEE